MQANAYFLTTFGTDTSAPRWPFGLNLLAFCLKSVFCAWRSGPPAAGGGLRENCHLGAFFFPRASLFSTFLWTLARSSRAFLFVIVIFRVGRPFSCFPPGRPSMRWVGPKIAALQLAPVRAAGCCRGLHVRLAWRSSFFVFTPLHACRLSGQPFFSACFPLFPTSTRKCVCVCVCVCEPFFFRADALRIS